MPRAPRLSSMVSLIVLASLVGLFGFVFFRVMAGFLLPMFMALLLAIVFQPVHQLIVQRTGGHPRLAAGLTTIAIIVIVLAPLLGILARATLDATDMLKTSGGLRLDEAELEKYVTRVNEWLPQPVSAADVHDKVRVQSQAWLEQIALATPGTVGGILVGLFVTVFSLYYFLADGREMIGSTVRLLPLRDQYQVQLFDEFQQVARAVITATIVSALLQGFFAGLGFRLAGLESIFLLILLTMLTSMIPLIGAAPVWLGAAAWLYFHDQPWAALALAIYGVTVMVVVDNVVRPLILHGRAKLHPLLGLLSVLGGVQLLGPIGLFVGPMAVAFLQAGLNMLHLELLALDKGRRK